MKGNGQQAKYVALSHCWGAFPLWVTTTKNQVLPSFTQLPGNFQDAIIITRMLGFQYLWIDSLCILQDSAEDWAIECKNMASIYQNAEITISVRDNTSSSPGGFLQELHHKPSKSCIISDGLTICNEFFDYHPLQSPIPQGRVDGRGWILQEKLLSRRLLHFGAGKLIFQCCTDVHLDSVHYNFPANAYYSTRYAAKKPLDQLKDSDAQEVRMYWYEIVEDYSTRDLTKRDDRLPALSGLARVFTKVLHEDYVAGLWSKDLGRGLCWKATWKWD